MSEYDKIAEALLEHSHSEPAPCDCIGFDDSMRFWRYECTCRNQDDAGQAAAWCRTKNLIPRIAKAIEEAIEEAVAEVERNVTTALDLISQFGGIDGGHHKQWVLDQVVRALAPDYDEWVREQKDGEDGPETYAWDEGIPP